ncbi:AEL293Cp [Eremothecium gossypii ATCC 10895]|uniref:AEL293Cp n=1 Tax=Eremothecium gossypii (strain ATCC 10895 / CBS 109.51 / FGSC 9923 / NRRL Y-1056) TaxID=284811 RepID=Q758P6_EREGS|nr:AEL293Cp [Eremothecium gossypii ATCC 10895]AAS52391.2 AEL293Cp [Eremothecium gossypii ATCC 10895]AEY96688.1 FAEL293Cp [Eremothecium gossypii FDAG1]
MEQEPHVIFMNPQTENLQNLYELVEKLARQLNKNKEQRQRLLREVDVLASKAQRGLGTSDFRKDARVVEEFLKRRGAGTGGGDGVESLRAQNSRLRALLAEKQCNNDATLGLLAHHENSLALVVRLLREDVFQHHAALVARCRRAFNERLCAAEDSEFRAYLENATSLQALIDISRVYQALLRLP